MTINIFADESCQNNHRYMVLSGVAVESTDLHRVIGDIKSVRAKHNIYGEFKWAKVSKSKRSAYIDLVDKFFHLSAVDLIHFHSVTIDTERLDHAKYNLGDSEIGFNKFIYQLLMKFGRKYRGNDINCYLHRRTTNQSLDELRAMLNNGIAKRFGVMSQPYKRVHFLGSKGCDLLQLNDVLLGAVASRTNNHHMRPDASPTKSELSEHILRCANVRNPLADTPLSNSRFTIWNMVLKK